MPRFSEDFLDKVRTASPIADIIGERVPLVKNGRSFKACCPFHHEKTPSFHVTPERGIFKCFGCGKGGNVFQFLMEYEGLSFAEAVMSLAERAGIQPDQSSGLDSTTLNRQAERQGRAKRLAALNQAALDFFQRQLTLPEGQPARKYLEGRAVSETARRVYKLGYAPDSWEDLCRHLQSLGYSSQELIASGIALEGQENKGAIDRFRNRLMFPIWDMGGQVVAFGGRAIDGSEPKYLNTAETELYHKSQVLYSLNFAKDAIKEMKKTAILCEGYLDVLTLAQNRFVNAVASCGTSLTPEQSRLLKRFADRAIVCYDGDSAGQKAALRAIPLLLNAGLDVYVAVLQGDEDPDSFLKKYGPEAFQKVLDEARPYFSFAMESLAKERNMDSSQERYALLRDLFPFLMDCQSEGMRLELMQELSDFAKIPLSSVSLDFANFERQQSARGKDRNRKNEKEKPREANDELLGENGLDAAPSPAESLFLALCLMVPDTLEYANCNLEPDAIGNVLARRLYYRIVQCQKEGGWFGPDQFLDDCDQEEREFLSGILTTAVLPERPKKRQDGAPPYWQRTLLDCIMAIKGAHYQEEIERLTNILKITTDKDLVRDLLSRIAVYSAKRRECSRIRTFKTMAAEHEKSNSEK